MRAQPGRQTSREELISELKRIAELVGVADLTTETFNKRSHLDAALVRRRFGTWNKGLKEAGIAIPPRARRYTDDECFENLLNLWMQYGRPPRFREMDVPPSVVGGTAYVKRWGTFKKALVAFIEKANSDVDSAEPKVAPSSLQNSALSVLLPERPERNKREVPLGVRYTVLNRDRFKCVLCGASPATATNCRLHVDHVVALARGGTNRIENLRTLCESCNLGKGSQSEGSNRGAG